MYGQSVLISLCNCGSFHRTYASCIEARDIFMARRHSKGTSLCVSGRRISDGRLIRDRKVVLGATISSLRISGSIILVSGREARSPKHLSCVRSVSTVSIVKLSNLNPSRTLRAPRKQSTLDFFPGSFWKRLGSRLEPNCAAKPNRTVQPM